MFRYCRWSLSFPVIWPGFCLNLQNFYIPHSHSPCYFLCIRSVNFLQHFSLRYSYNDRQPYNDPTNLRFSSLAYNTSNCVCMSCQCMDICLGPHIPDTACYISTSCYQNINVWMQCQTIHSTEMSMIVPNHLKWNTVRLFCNSCSYKWSHSLWNECCLGYKQI